MNTSNYASQNPIDAAIALLYQGKPVAMACSLDPAAYKPITTGQPAATPEPAHVGSALPKDKSELVAELVDGRLEAKKTLGVAVRATREISNTTLDGSL